MRNNVTNLYKGLGGNHLGLYHKIGIHGLGATPTPNSEEMKEGLKKLPDDYFKPKSKQQIEDYVNAKYKNYCKGKPFECVGEAFTSQAIDRSNLLFLNNFITYDQLQKDYKQWIDEYMRFIAEMPRIPKLGEQFKAMGKFLVGAVGGFLAAGPVGLFVGASGAVKQILQEEKDRRAGKAIQNVQSTIQTKTSDPTQTAAQKAQIEAEKQNLEQNEQLKKYITIGGAAIGAAAILYIITEN